MDASLITAALGSIRAAKDLATAAVGVRDWNLVAVELSKLNEQLLRAQDALFAHNAQLLELQQDLFDTKNQLRQANEALLEKGRYQLTETARGAWAYRSATPSNPAELGTEKAANARTHFVCQPCFDSGKKVVLQAGVTLDGTVLWCPVCKNRLGVELVKRELLSHPLAADRGDA